jgi:hypothetical protein
MKAEDLLIPRYELIADFPGRDSFNIDKVGSILTDNGERAITDENGHSIFVIKFEEYPHLFRKLNWWEYRKIEDMPKRLICKAIPNDTEINEIESWDMDILFGWTNKKERVGCGLLSFNPEYGYFPID